MKGLINIALGNSKNSKSLEDICQKHCPKEFHIDKAESSGVRLSDWGQWPLSDSQVRYASLDAVLSFSAFFYQRKEHRYLADWDLKGSFRVTPSEYSVESTSVVDTDESVVDQSGAENKAVGANNDFFAMMRNRSVSPPLAGKKEYPNGSKVRYCTN